MKSFRVTLFFTLISELNRFSFLESLTDLLVVSLHRATSSGYRSQSLRKGNISVILSLMLGEKKVSCYITMLHSQKGKVIPQNLWRFCETAASPCLTQLE